MRTRRAGGCVTCGTRDGQGDRQDGLLSDNSTHPQDTTSALRPSVNFDSIDTRKADWHGEGGSLPAAAECVGMYVALCAGDALDPR